MEDWIMEVFTQIKEKNLYQPYFHALPGFPVDQSHHVDPEVK